MHLVCIRDVYMYGSFSREVNGGLPWVPILFLFFLARNANATKALWRHGSLSPLTVRAKEKKTVPRVMQWRRCSQIITYVL